MTLPSKDELTQAIESSSAENSRLFLLFVAWLVFLVLHLPLGQDLEFLLNESPMVSFWELAIPLHIFALLASGLTLLIFTHLVYHLEMHSAKLRLWMHASGQDPDQVVLLPPFVLNAMLWPKSNTVRWVERFSFAALGLAPLMISAAYALRVSLYLQNYWNNLAQILILAGFFFPILVLWHNVRLDAKSWGQASGKLPTIGLIRRWRYPWLGWVVGLVLLLVPLGVAYLPKVYSTYDLSNLDFAKIWQARAGQSLGTKDYFDFAGRRLRAADFSGSTLSNLHFSQADLSRVDFRRANFAEDFTAERALFFQAQVDQGLVEHYCRLTLGNPECQEAGYVNSYHLCVGYLSLGLEVRGYWQGQQQTALAQALEQRMERHCPTLVQDLLQERAGLYQFYPYYRFFWQGRVEEIYQAWLQEERWRQDVLPQP